MRGQIMMMIPTMMEMIPPIRPVANAISHLLNAKSQAIYFIIALIKGQSYGWGQGAMVIEKSPVTTAPSLSTALTVKLNTPAVSGVPYISP